LIGDEAGRGVPAGTEELGQGGAGGAQPPEPLDVELVRPATGEQAGVRRQRPGRGGSSLIESNPLHRQSREVRRGVATVAVQAEVVGTDGIQYDEQDVRRKPRRRETATAANQSGAGVSSNGQPQEGDQNDRQCRGPAVDEGP